MCEQKRSQHFFIGSGGYYILHFPHELMTYRRTTHDFLSSPEIRWVCELVEAWNTHRGLIKWLSRANATTYRENQIIFSVTGWLLLTLRTRRKESVTEKYVFPFFWIFLFVELNLFVHCRDAIFPSGHSLSLTNGRRVLCTSFFSFTAISDFPCRILNFVHFLPIEGKVRFILNTSSP